MSTDSLIRNQIAERNRPVFSWLDGLWLIFLAGLAVLPPVNEIHKQLILLAIGLVQVGEGWLLARLPARGPAYIVILKIGLASLLIAHTGEVAINSRYYLIYYLPVLTAAVYFGVWGTLGWIALTSAAYCSFLIPALQEYTLEPDDATELALRILFFFIVGVLVNRLVIEVRLQTLRYQRTAEALAETNRQLESAQEEARRSERLAALGSHGCGTRARDSKSTGSDQGFRGNAEPEDRADKSAGERTRGLHFERGEPAELLCDAVSGLRSATADRAASALDSRTSR